MLSPPRLSDDLQMIVKALLDPKVTEKPEIDDDDEWVRDGDEWERVGKWGKIVQAIGVAVRSELIAVNFLSTPAEKYF